MSERPRPFKIAKVVANEVVAIWSNARQTTGNSPESSFALPGILSRHAVEVQFGPAGPARPPPDSLAHIRKTRSPVLSASGHLRTNGTAILRVRTWG